MKKTYLNLAVSSSYQWLDFFVNLLADRWVHFFVNLLADRKTVDSTPKYSLGA